MSFNQLRNICVCLVNFSIFSVLIGAPRAQSTLEIQRKINETGAIYKCTFDQSTDGSCAPFVFDQWGNVHDSMDQFTYNNEKKDYQWLGASMDGNSNDNDKLVVSTVCRLPLTTKYSKRNHNPNLL